MAIAPQTLDTASSAALPKVRQTNSRSEQNFVAVHAGPCFDLFEIPRGGSRGCCCRLLANSLAPH